VSGHSGLSRAWCSVEAERQQDHMLVVRVQVIRVPRPSKRVSSPLQNSLLHSHNANQFMLVRFLPIPRHRANPSLEPAILSKIMASSQEGPCCADVSTFPGCRFSRVSTEHRLGKDHRGDGTDALRTGTACTTCQDHLVSGSGLRCCSLPFPRVLARILSSLTFQCVS
jgi:hypothetical protein